MGNSVVGLGITIALMFFGKMLHDEVKVSNEKVQEMQLAQSSHSARLENLLLDSQQNPDYPFTGEHAYFQKLMDFGWGIKHSRIQESFAADHELQSLLPELPPSKYPITIQKLPLEIDQLRVAIALEQAGYVVRGSQYQAELVPGQPLPTPSPKPIEEEPVAESKEPADTEKPDDSKETDDKAPTDIDAEKKETGNKPANVLMFGTLVRNTDIKVIAYILLRSGAELKGIIPYPSATTSQARTVDFVWNEAYKNRDPIKVSAIKETVHFRR
ncbi:MAG: hypothetical protein V4629_05555 [Pseudomonadota bacterium]